MSRVVPPEKWSRYFAERKMGASVYAAARTAGIDKATCYRMEKGDPTSSGAQLKKVIDAEELPDVIAYDALRPEAKRALEDFGYFRQRYFGRISSPWQEQVGYDAVGWIESPDKEYIVQNCPPGAGKSTILHDLVCWLICRNRGIRIMIGSATARQATQYSGRVRRSMERRQPVKADPEQVTRGLAVDAESTLLADFGRFKPLAQDLWRQEEFIVAQVGDIAVEDKEPTVAAYGMDSGFLGGRFDLVVWDDLVDKRTTRTVEMREAQQEWWDGEAETRVEPGGCLILNGQRMTGEDLYRYCLDKRLLPDDEDDDPESDEVKVDGIPMYKHVVYKAHYPDLCSEGSHRKDAPPYLRGGCLLDPRRLSWKELRNKRADRFLVMYQQEDGDPDEALVNPLWIKGGRGTDGVEYPGCWDNDRGLAQIPQGLHGDKFSVVCADPSPTKFWAIGWWLYHPDSEQRFLLDLHRQAMDAPDFLDWDANNNRFTGLLEEWWVRANDAGAPFSHVIVEANAAQRFLLQYDHVRRWMTLRKVNIVPHQTHRNKSDEKFGVQTIAPHYRHGRVRLPGKSSDGSRVASLKLVDEVTRWPEGSTDDCVMQHWFLEWNLPNLNVRRRKPPQQQRPSWMRGRGVSRGVAA